VLRCWQQVFQAVVTCLWLDADLILDLLMMVLVLACSKEPLSAHELHESLRHKSGPSHGALD
jgi:hypothetical protein